MKQLSISLQMNGDSDDTGDSGRGKLYFNEIGHQQSRDKLYK